jgi:hypothetical protein
VEAIYGGAKRCWVCYGGMADCAHVLAIEDDQQPTVRLWMVLLIVVLAYLGMIGLDNAAVDIGLLVEAIYGGAKRCWVCYGGMADCAHVLAIEDDQVCHGALDRGAGVLGYDRPGQRRCRYRSTWPPRLGH